MKVSGFYYEMHFHYWLPLQKNKLDFPNRIVIIITEIKGQILKLQIIEGTNIDNICYSSLDCDPQISDISINITWYGRHLP